MVQESVEDGGCEVAITMKGGGRLLAGVEIVFEQPVEEALRGQIILVRLGQPVEQALGSMREPQLGEALDGGIQVDFGLGLGCTATISLPARIWT